MNWGDKLLAEVATHANRTDAGHDLALGQMPMAHQPRPAVSSQLVGVVAKNACNLGLHGVRQ
jgi:hypothetical protein